MYSYLPNSKVSGNLGAKIKGISCYATVGKEWPKFSRGTQACKGNPPYKISIPLLRHHTTYLILVLVVLLQHRACLQEALLLQFGNVTGQESWRLSRDAPGDRRSLTFQFLVPPSKIGSTPSKFPIPSHPTCPMFPGGFEAYLSLTEGHLSS